MNLEHFDELTRASIIITLGVHNPSLGCRFWTGILSAERGGDNLNTKFNR